MKYICSFAVALFSVISAYAQSGLNITPSLTNDGKTVTLQMQVAMTAVDSESKVSYVITPKLTDGRNEHTFHNMTVPANGGSFGSKRAAMLAKRRGESDSNAQGVNTYKDEVAYESWMAAARLEISSDKKEKGKAIGHEQINYGAMMQTVPSSLPATPAYSYASATTQPGVSTAPTSLTGMLCNYIEPVADLVDDRNKKEFDFNIEEARVVASLTPELLSLRELFLVAISYKNDSERFRRTLNLSVTLYPASPIANLNAASCALEMNDVAAAAQYVKKIQVDSPESKNVRGVYELLTGNYSEGIRLLKSAKKDGLAEADKNLTTFFDYFQKYSK